jgi:RsiW-degrading membrane proteinase PrsW (M82 family)
MDEKRPGGDMKPASTHEPTKSQLLPFDSKWQELIRKPYFWPGVATVLVVMALFSYVGDRTATFTVKFRDVVPVGVPLYAFALGLFILAATGYFLYRIAGKTMPWWALPAVAAGTAVLTMSPVMNAVHAVVSLGVSGGSGKDDNVVTAFVKMFFNAGLPEELLKAIPVAIGVWLAVKITNRSSPLWSLRVTEPIDGMLIGIAAGLGFAFAETMFVYVPRTMLDNPGVTAALQAALAKLGIATKLPPDTPHYADAIALFKALVGKIGLDKAAFELNQVLQLRQAAGLELMIPRLLANICGHAAYAGVFGYFIGLAAMKPANRVKTLAIGLALAAGVHAAWNATGTGHLLLGTIVKLAAFALLTMLILKAREISPNRAELAPSQLIDRFARVPMPAAAAAAAGPAADAPAQAGAARSLTWTDATDVLVIEIGTARVPATVGARLYERQAPGTTASRGDGIVAEVNANPNDATMLGIKNVSNQIWHVTTEQGERRELTTGRSIRIARGTKIQMGDLIAEVK